MNKTDNEILNFTRKESQATEWKLWLANIVVLAVFVCADDRFMKQQIHSITCHYFL